MQGIPAFALSLPLPCPTSAVAKCIARAPKRSFSSRRSPSVRRSVSFAVASDASATASAAHATDGIVTHRADPLVKTSADDATNHITDDSDNIERSAIEGLEDVAELINSVQETEILDFLFEDHGVTVQISRPGGLGFDSDGNINPQPDPAFAPQPDLADPSAVLQPVAPSAPSAPPAAPTSTSSVDLPGKSSTTESTTVQDAVEKDPDQIYETDFVVTSNRVGFFFCGAKNKPPLVNIDDSVAFNQPVCIIEQLGQQYVYLSEASGKVVKVFVEDGDVVEYGTQIMVIRPD